MSATKTQLPSSGEFCKLHYDNIPVKSAFANVSFYDNSSKMPNFELWYFCRKLAIYFTLTLYVGKLFSLQCGLLTFDSTNLESSGMEGFVKHHCYNTEAYRLSLNTNNTPIFQKKSALVLRWKYQFEPHSIKITLYRRSADRFI